MRNAIILIITLAFSSVFAETSSDKFECRLAVFYPSTAYTKNVYFSIPTQITTSEELFKVEDVEVKWEFVVSSIHGDWRDAKFEFRYASSKVGWIRNFVYLKDIGDSFNFERSEWEENKITPTPTTYSVNCLKKTSGVFR
jgi:hypothetical protein